MGTAMQTRKTAIILASVILFVGLFVVYCYTFLIPMYEEQQKTEQYLQRLQQEKQAEFEQQRRQEEIAQQQQAELEQQRQQINLKRQREEMARRQREIEEQRRETKFATPQPQQIAPKGKNLTRARKQAFLNDCLKSAHENYKQAWEDECWDVYRKIGCRLPLHTVNLFDRRLIEAKNDCYRRANMIE